MGLRSRSVVFFLGELLETQKAGTPKGTGLLFTEAKTTCASLSLFSLLLSLRLSLLFSWWPCFFLSFVFFERLLRRRTPCISHCAAHRHLNVRCAKRMALHLLT